MANIIAFKKLMVGRDQAIRWLATNKIEYPRKVPGKISAELFHGWRFIEATDGVVYFADFIHQGIDSWELDECRAHI